MLEKLTSDKKPTISIHIVTYNSERDIISCLKGVFQQTYPVEQIVIIDNASGDHTVNMIRAYNGRNIKLYTNGNNEGFAKAHNQAIKKTESDFFLVLNPDVFLHPEYIEQIMRFAVNNHKAGSFTGCLLSANSHVIIDSTGLIMTKQRRSFDRGSGEDALSWRDSSEVFGVSGAASIYLREMVKDISVGGEFFDPVFFAYKEDVDVAWRARLMGWKAYYVSEASAYHGRGWKSEDRSKQPLKIRQHSYINRYYMILKNDSIIYLTFHMPWIVSYELAVSIYILIREPQLLLTWLKGRKTLAVMWRKRKWIQKNKRASLASVYKSFHL